MKQVKNNKNRAETGFIGENTASNFLINKNYRIIHRNYRISNVGEIDIIAEEINGVWPLRSKIIVFVEVKTLKLANIARKSFDPESHVNLHKQKKLLKLANLYMAKNKIPRDAPWRIDVVAVEIDGFTGNIVDIRHHENAIHL